ncbi:MAG: RodZ domain-containing protein [Bdellovibrionales bacterium]
MTSEAASPPADNPAPKPKRPQDRLGVILRHAREDKGLSPEACEEQLRIKAEYILALENGQYNILPTATHAKGFLRTYAIFLGLEGRLPELQHKFQEETSDFPATPQLVTPAPLPEARLPAKGVAIGGIAIAVVIYLLYLWVSAPAETDVVKEPLAPPAPAMSLAPLSEAELVQAPPSPDLVAPAVDAPAAAVPVVEEQKPAPEAVAVPPKPVAAPTADGKPANVTIKATGDTWVQVQDAMGATIYSKLMKDGDTYTPPDLPGLTLMTGNAGGIVLVRDGDEGDALGKDAEVKRGVQLTKPAKKAPAEDE